MDKFTLNLLSPDFYKAYPPSSYPELESKSSRPYVVLVVLIDGNRYAIPFRTTVRHPYCFKFAKTGRTSKASTAIDYTKAVIVNDPKFIGQAGYVDHLEYMELTSHIGLIVKQFEAFVRNYVKYASDPIKFAYQMKKFDYCTLKYFRKELGLSPLGNQ